MRGWILGLALLATTNAIAHECQPVRIESAEFGPRELATTADCPGIPSNEEQSCSLIDGGVAYGVSEGLIVNKEVESGTYRAGLPFNLHWDDDLVSAIQKVSQTDGTPEFFVSGDPKGFELGSDTCLKTKAGGEYNLTLEFDADRKLRRIVGRIIYP